VHRGDFVDRASREDDRWSRWARSSTTFGPLGRISWSVIVVGGLLWSSSHVFFVSWFCLLLIGIVVLRDVWAPTRVVPPRPPHAEGAGPPAPASIEQGQIERRAPLPRAVVVFRSILAVAGIAALLASIYGDAETKAVVAMAGVLIGAYAFFRGFLT
jgi:hypothetical protein